MKNYFLGIIILLLFTSCTSTTKFQMDNLYEEGLDKNQNIAITVCEDGIYGSDIYIGSGRTVANILKQQLASYGKKVTVLRNKEVFEDLTEDDFNNYEYFFIPEIIHWEDRATVWSGLPDKVEIAIDVYDSNKNLLKSVILTGKSASITLGTTDLSELIQEPFADFCKAVFK